MNIDTIISNIQNAEFSLKSELLEDLNNDVSSCNSVSISCSFEIQNELKTDLYGKDNAENRKFKLLEIPIFIK